MDVRELIREIHRRSLWQVISVYLVGCWVAIQVVQTLTTSLGLPEWFPSMAVVLLIVGFPVVLATAIVQEGPPGVESARTDASSGGSQVAGNRVGPEGRRPSSPDPVPAEDGGSPVAAWLTWRKALAGGVVAFALWGVVAAGWLLFAPPAGGAGEAGASADAADAPPPVTSLAVLPLDNHTGHDARQYLVDGTHEAVIHELARIRDLTVKSRTSVMRFRGGEVPIPEIAEGLGGVDRVVEGSVFQVPGSDSLRVTVQLIDAATDEHLWSGEYWGDLRRIRALHGRVARGIADRIRGDLSSGPLAERDELSPLVPEAVELYMRARAEWRTGTAESMQRSIGLYRRTLEVEPEYALAWSGLADAYLVLAHIRVPAHRAFPEAKEAARRALEIDPGLAQAHTALADTRFHYDWDWEGSEASFRRALELNPGYAPAHWWYSGLLAALGRMDESVARITRARELDPLSPQSHGFAVRILYYARRHEDALEVVGRIRRLGVSEFMTPPWAALAHHALGDGRRALGLLEEIPEARRSPYVRTALIQVLSATGEEERARRELSSLVSAYREDRLHLPHLVAIGHASLGERDHALDWLETAAEDRDGALPWLTVEPAFDGLRSEPRFRALLERMALSGT